MYLFQAQPNQDNNQPLRLPPTTMGQLTRKEIMNVALTRTTLKDPTSSKLKVKGPRQADAVQKATMVYLRSQLADLPEGLREESRMKYLLQQNIQRRDLQEFQCAMIGRLERVLRANIIASGLNYKKYKIGGYDGGTYGEYFK